jgi:hypothetical protein
MESLKGRREALIEQRDRLSRVSRASTAEMLVSVEDRLAGVDREIEKREARASVESERLKRENNLSRESIKASLTAPSVIAVKRDEQPESAVAMPSISSTRMMGVLDKAPGTSTTARLERATVDVVGDVQTPLSRGMGSRLSNSRLSLTGGSAADKARLAFLIGGAGGAPPSLGQKVAAESQGSEVVELAAAAATTTTTAAEAAVDTDREKEIAAVALEHLENQKRWEAEEQRAKEEAEASAVAAAAVAAEVVKTKAEQEAARVKRAEEEEAARRHFQAQLEKQRQEQQRILEEEEKCYQQQRQDKERQRAEQCELEERRFLEERQEIERKKQHDFQRTQEEEQQRLEQKQRLEEQRKHRLEQKRALGEKLQREEEETARQRKEDELCRKQEERRVIHEKEAAQQVEEQQRIWQEQEQRRAKEEKEENEQRGMTVEKCAENDGNGDESLPRDDDYSRGSLSRRGSSESSSSGCFGGISEEELEFLRQATLLHRNTEMMSDNPVSFKLLAKKNCLFL